MAFSGIYVSLQMDCHRSNAIIFLVVILLLYLAIFDRKKGFLRTRGTQKWQFRKENK